MTTEPTKEMIALAREIAEARVPDRSFSTHAMVLAMRELAYDAALAAIQADMEKAAALAVAWRDECKASVPDGDRSEAAHKVRGAAIEMNAFYRALLRGDHLKETPDV